MDVFKFINPTAVDRLEQGEIINNLTSKMWLERYDEAGEFEFVAHPRSGLRTTLPIGSFVSHVDTKEVMIVENHELVEDEGSEPQLTITGRGFESFFEHRVVGSSRDYSVVLSPQDYLLSADTLWNQIVTIIKYHVHPGFVVDVDNALYYVTILTDISGSGEQVEREIKVGSLYSRLVELLQIDNLGIKIIRPGPWSPLGAGSEDVAIIIHRGVDRSNEIIFSHDTGEISRADHLWSNKKLKNSAIVSGRWVEEYIEGTETGYNRRMMHIDASDIDGAYEAMPTGTTLTNVRNALRQRGFETLARQNEVSLSNIDVSKELANSRYRQDFDVGDIVAVTGDYSTSTKRRISEYVEIEDETGQYSYPTLTEITEET